MIISNTDRYLSLQTIPHPAATPTTSDTIFTPTHAGRSGRTPFARCGTQPTETWSISHAQRRTHHELSQGMKTGEARTRKGDKTLDLIRVTKQRTGIPVVATEWVDKNPYPQLHNPPKPSLTHIYKPPLLAHLHNFAPLQPTSYPTTPPHAHTTMLWWGYIRYITWVSFY